MILLCHVLEIQQHHPVEHKLQQISVANLCCDPL